MSRIRAGQYRYFTSELNYVREVTSGTVAKVLSQTTSAPGVHLYKLQELRTGTLFVADSLVLMMTSHRMSREMHNMLVGSHGQANWYDKLKEV